MNFDKYDLNQTIYDEMFTADGAPREHCEGVYDALSTMPPDVMADIQERMNRSFSSEGITFTVYGDDEADERIIPRRLFLGVYYVFCRM